MRMAADEVPEIDTATEALQRADLSKLTDEAELELIKTLAAWPRTLELAAEAHEPHRLAFFCSTLRVRSMDCGRKEVVKIHPYGWCATRLPSLLERVLRWHATQIVIASGLAIFGVEPADEMR